MQLIVKAKSSFGVLNANDEKWYNPADKVILETMQKGKAYEVELVDVMNKGKKYTNIKSAKLIDVDTPAPAVVAPKAVAKAKAKDNEPVDWAAKDRSQLVGGRSHDAVELVKASLQSGTPMPEVLKTYKDALVGVLKIADEVK